MKRYWLNKEECTGCGACMNICPKQAIHMLSDHCGFSYPQISESCIECGLCEKICVSRISNSMTRYHIPDTYAVWSKNEETRFNSTSGGAFSEFAKAVLRQGGYVVGAQYKDNHTVEHVIIHQESDLKKIRQSKYVQSSVNLIYKEVRALLDKKIMVLFGGTPCQVAALYSYLGQKTYENLITMDFICRGVNSPKAYQSWLAEIEKQEKSRITKVWFKYKAGGWKSSPKRTRIDFEDGHYIIKEDTENLFMQGYLAYNLYMRPCCGTCKFKGIPRQSDITMADFWGIDPYLDDDKGTSLLLINSESGKRILSDIKNNIIVYKKDFSDILDGNIYFSESVCISPKSEQFLKSLDGMIFSDALKKYSKVHLKDKVKRLILRIFHLICRSKP